MKKKIDMKKLTIEFLNDQLISDVKETYINNMIDFIENSIKKNTSRDFVTFLKETKSVKKFIRGNDEFKAKKIIFWIQSEMWLSEIMIEDETLSELDLYRYDSKE